VAREVLAIYRDESILEQSQARAVQLARGFAALGEIPGVRRTRSLGMVAAADLGEGGDLGRAVHDAARARGAQLRPLGDTIYVVPPLNIDPAVLDDLLRVVHASVVEALAREREAPRPSIC